MYESDK